MQHYNTQQTGHEITEHTPHTESNKRPGERAKCPWPRDQAAEQRGLLHEADNVAVRVAPGWRDRAAT